MKPENFQNLIRRILKEEVEKRSDTNKPTYQRVPEVVHGEDYKKKDVSPQTRDTKTKYEMLDDMDKVVKAINKDYMVVWDDHDDISITAPDLFKIRVIPKWENNFCIEAMTRNEDRIFITGQTWEQVKEFVKVNLKDSKTSQEVAYNKAIANVTGKNDTTSKADKDLPQKDKPKTLPLTNEPPSKTKNKEKNYTEDEVKNDDDLPEKPMKEVKEFERQIDHKVKDPVKLRKRNPDTKLFAKGS
jgi:hypothetical protein